MKSEIHHILDQDMNIFFIDFSNIFFELIYNLVLPFFQWCWSGLIVYGSAKFDAYVTGSSSIKSQNWLHKSFKSQEKKYFHICKVPT